LPASKQEVRHKARVYAQGSDRKSDGRAGGRPFRAAPGFVSLLLPASIFCHLPIQISLAAFAPKRCSR